MTVKEALTAAKITPNPAYTGIETADDMILGVQTEHRARKPATNIPLFSSRVTEHSGAINALQLGYRIHPHRPRHHKTGAQRQITINGERFAGDPFQDFALSPQNQVRTPARTW